MVSPVIIITFLALFSIVFVSGWAISRLSLATSRGQVSRATGDPTPASVIVLQGFADQLPTSMLDDDDLEKDLHRAGYYAPTARRTLTGLRNALAIIVALAAGSFAVAIGPDHQLVVTIVVVGGLMLAFVLWCLPRVILGVKAHYRMKRIDRGLPDALDMIHMCMMSGQTFQDAIYQVALELTIVHPDVTTELMIIRRHAEMKSIKFAFDQFANRIDSEDVIGLSVLVAQDERLGSGIGRSIRDYSDSLRSQQRFRADEKGNSAAIKLLFPITLCLLPAAVLMFMTPTIIELVNFMLTFDQNRVPM